MLRVKYVGTVMKTLNFDEDKLKEGVVIVGRTCQNGQIYYPFWEVGTSKGKEGYKFKLESNNHLTCDKPYRKVPEPYIVTQIRMNRNKEGLITLDKLKKL